MDNKNPIPKIRKTWSRNPVERPHSTPKGAKGYKRVNRLKSIDLIHEKQEEINEELEWLDYRDDHIFGD